MPRPKLVGDEEILAATAKAVQEHGPLTFTLDQVARAAGVTAPLLVHRFGNKRGLLLALVSSGSDVVARTFAAERARHKRALDALPAALAQLMPASPRAVASGLAFLQLDVTDAEFRKHAIAFFDAFHAEVRALLDEAVRAKELARVDTAALARAVEVAYNGSVLRWALRQEGTLARALEEDVEAVVGPFMTKRRGVRPV